MKSDTFREMLTSISNQYGEALTMSHLRKRVGAGRDISEGCAQRSMYECQVLPDRSGIRILHTPLRAPVVKSLDRLGDALAGDESAMQEETLFADAVSIQKCGRGEWTAETLDDAKQMAIDFANGVA